MTTHDHPRHRLQAPSATRARARARAVLPWSLLAGATLALAACDGGGEPESPASSSGPDAPAAAATSAGPSEASVPAADATAAGPAAAGPAGLEGPAPSAASAAAPSVPSAFAPFEPRRGNALPDTIDPAGPGPQLVVDRALHDFGRMYDGRVVQATFTIRNAGDEPLLIEDVSTSCGCTTAGLPKSVYQPGETETLTIDYEPKGVGRQNQRITIVSNDPDQPRAELRITADVEPFMITSRKFVRFDDVPLGGGANDSFTVSSADPGFELDAVRLTGLHPELFEVARSAGGPRVAGPLRPGQVAPAADGAATVEVRVRDGAPWGAYYANIVVEGRGRRTPGGPMEPHETTIPVHAVVYGELVASRPRFAVGRVDPGGAFRRAIELESRSGRPFEVTAARVAECEFPGMQVNATPVAGTDGAKWSVVVSGSVGSFMGTLKGRVEIETDLPGEEAKVSIETAGIVRPLERDN